MTWDLGCTRIPRSDDQMRWWSVNRPSRWQRQGHGQEEVQLRGFRSGGYLPPPTEAGA